MEPRDRVGPNILGDNFACAIVAASYLLRIRSEVCLDYTPQVATNLLIEGLDELILVADGHGIVTGEPSEENHFACVANGDLGRPPFSSRA